MNSSARPRLSLKSPPQLSAAPFEPAQAPWIRPGVVVHEAGMRADELLAKFALTLRQRGFQVAGCLRFGQNGDRLLDLASNLPFEIASMGEAEAAAKRMRAAMRDEADLVVVSHFSYLEGAARSLKATVGQGPAQGMPVLTAITGDDIHDWLGFAGQDGSMISPNMKNLWRWWGPERLYRDLALGVAEDEVVQIACGQRWIMVEGPHGSGLAYLPRYPKELLPRLPGLTRRSLRQLAELSASWDPAEMALGIAAINAHYNRLDQELPLGNGTHHFTQEQGRVVAVGAFPGLGSVLPNCAVIETDPRPGEYPTVAMDSLLPGSSAAVVNSSTLINRNLPRILRLAQGARVAMVGPSTPMTPRLHHYGVEVLGGLQITNPKGMAAAVKAGAHPKDFLNYGRFVHQRQSDEQHKPCRFLAPA